MPNPAIAIGGGSIVGGILQGRSAKKAANAQERAALAGIDEQARQFDEIKALLSPFVSAGSSAISQQAALIGLGGEEAQTAALDRLRNGPEFQALLDEGENSIRQNASATGGLRGGNTQRALMEFSPRLLAETYDRQFSRLGDITRIGQASAAGQAAAGQNASNNISGLYGQIGAAQAGNALAQGQAWQSGLGGLAMLAGGGF